MFAKSLKYALATALVVLSAPAFAQDAPDYIVPTGDGDTYSIDFDALNSDASLTDSEKAIVLSALVKSPNIQTTELIGIGGIDVSCDLHWTSADCTLTISKSTTATLANMSPVPLAVAICAPITAESGDVLEVVCAPALAFIANSTIKPALQKCVDQSKGVKLNIKFSLFHPKRDTSASATCE